MYARKSHKLISVLTVLVGILGAVLRLALPVFGTDQQGMIPAFQPLGIGLWVVVALVFAQALYQSLSLKPIEEYADNFPKSLIRFLGHLLGSLGILATVLLSQPGIRGNMALAWKVLGFASVPCLLVAGWMKFRGNPPFFALHLCPALFLVAHTVSQYQTWSSDPQLLNYIFPLLAMISMMFFAFYQSAFDVGLIWRRKLTFFGLTTIALGIVVLPGSTYPWLNLGVVLWALMDRPAPVPRRRRRNPITEVEPQ